jgi:hypothetical protein
MKNLILAASALCALALPAVAQTYYDGADAYPSAGYADDRGYYSPYSDAYDQGYRDAMRRHYGEERVAVEDVYVGPPIDPYGQTTAERHPLHGKYNFSMDGTSKVGGWTAVGPHTTWGMAVGGAAGGSTGGVYSTGP